MSDFGDETPRRRDSFEEKILRLLDAEPFVPFTVVVTSGDKYPVTGPHSLAIGESTMMSIYLPKRGTGHFRKSQIVAVIEDEAIIES